MNDRSMLARLDEWLDRDAGGLAYGIAVAFIVFGVLAGLLVAG